MQLQVSKTKVLKVVLGAKSPQQLAILKISFKIMHFSIFQIKFSLKI